MMVMRGSNRNHNSTWRPQAVLGRLQKALIPAGWQQEGLLGMRGSIQRKTPLENGSKRGFL